MQSISIAVNPQFLLWRTESDHKQVGLGCIDLPDDVAALHRIVFKAKGRRIYADNVCIRPISTDLFGRLLRYARPGAKKKYAHRALHA